jgi:hypothetical protein
MDSSKFGGSNLENSALERALKRRKDKANHLKQRERPLLARANAIRRDEERDALRPPLIQTVVSVKKIASKDGDAGNNEENEQSVFDENGVPLSIRFQEPKEDLRTPMAHGKLKSDIRQDMHPLEINTNVKVALESPASPNLFPYSPFDTASPGTSGHTTPNSQGSFSPRARIAGTNTIGQPLLGSDEVSTD